MTTEVESTPAQQQCSHSEGIFSRYGAKAEAAVQRIAPWLVVVAAAGIYLNSLQNGFAMDDAVIIRSNTRVHNLMDWRQIWLQPYWPRLGTETGLYRPFAIFLYALEWTIGRGAPWVFHTCNVLLHALATLLAFLLLDRLTARIPALVGSLLFALHPVHVEAVANIVGQAELVAATTLFAGCLLHITRPPGAAVSWPRRCALVGLFAIGVFTKESAAVLPPLLILFDVAQRRVRLDRRSLAEYAMALLVPLFLLAATLVVYLSLRAGVLGAFSLGLNASPSVPHLADGHRVLNAFRAFPEFMRLLIFPQDLSIDYSPGVLLPVESMTAMTSYGAFLLLSLTALALATHWKPAAGLPAAWFLITILPVSNLLFPIGVLVAERTLYTPSFAVGLAVAFAWLKAAPHASSLTRRLAPVVFAVTLVLFGVRTWTRTPVWKSNHHVAASLLRDHPESYRAHLIMGVVLWERGNDAGAEERYASALRIYPRDPQVLVFYAGMLHARGKTREAIGLLERSYAMAPHHPRTVVTLADAYLADGQYARALDFAQRADRIGPTSPQTLALRAMAYHGLRRHDRAVGAWRVAAATAAAHQSVILAHLARALVIAGYDDAAPVALERARHFAQDPANRQRIQQLTAAISAGCYDGLRSGPSGTPPFVPPQCDPLRDFQWSEFRRGA